MNYRTKLRGCLESELNRLNKIGNKQYNDDETFKMTKEIQTSILVKENKTFTKKKRNRLRYSLKRIRIKTLILNIYKTWEIIIYKELSRRLTLQEMNTIK